MHQWVVLFNCQNFHYQSSTMCQYFFDFIFFVVNLKSRSLMISDNQYYEKNDSLYIVSISENDFEIIKNIWYLINNWFGSVAIDTSYTLVKEIKYSWCNTWIVYLMVHRHSSCILFSTLRTSIFFHRHNNVIATHTDSPHYNYVFVEENRLQHDIKICILRVQKASNLFLNYLWHDIY